MPPLYCCVSPRMARGGRGCQMRDAQDFARARNSPGNREFNREEIFSVIRNECGKRLFRRAFPKPDKNSRDRKQGITGDPASVHGVLSRARRQGAQAKDGQKQRHGGNLRNWQGHGNWFGWNWQEKVADLFFLERRKAQNVPRAAAGHTVSRFGRTSSRAGRVAWASHAMVMVVTTQLDFHITLGGLDPPIRLRRRTHRMAGDDDPVPLKTKSMTE